MSLLSVPGYQLQPSAEQVPLSTNYLTNFNFMNQYLPDTYEKEFERYGNRTVASFLRMVGAEMPSISDQIKWAEQGRLHTKYTKVVTGAVPSGSPVSNATFTVNDLNVTGIAIRAGQTVMITPNVAGGGSQNKGIVTAVNTATDTFTVAFYEAAGFNNNNTAANEFTVFIYGSEFKKGTNGMQGSLESEDDIYSNKPIIIKDKYAVSGSDMAQVGWVEVTTENGASGYLWYIKSEHETRLRFEDYLEMAMVEGIHAATSSGAAAAAVLNGSAYPAVSISTIRIYRSYLKPLSWCYGRCITSHIYIFRLSCNTFYRFRFTFFIKEFGKLLWVRGNSYRTMEHLSVL